MRLEIEQNGKILLATSFDAADSHEVDALWQEATEVPLEVEFLAPDVQPSADDPLSAQIIGWVDVRMVHVDSVESEVRLKGLRLQRPNAASESWSLTADAAHRAIHVVHNPLKPLQVFILAGQSNMQGSGIIAADPKRNGGKGSLEFIAANADAQSPFGHLRSESGEWKSRDDVMISYFDRAGSLTVGFGAGVETIGPELGFGWTIGDHFDEPVLLIKVAWGGKAVGKEFRPPSAGGEIGESYTAMIAEIQRVLADVDPIFPSLEYSEVKLMGIGWHQGWNDRVNQAFNDVYEKNLSCLIRDMRAELGHPALPFVIAETGMSGHEEKHPRALSLMKAQAAVAQREEFVGNVAFVGTKDFWRDKSQSPSGQAYHWNNNAETFFLIGAGMADAMLQLLKR